MGPNLTEDLSMRAGGEASGKLGVEMGVDAHAILERIYDVALNPAVLETLIDLWADADPSEPFPAERSGTAFDAFVGSHLERAGQFLRREDAARGKPADHLKPYESFAAFTVDRSLAITDVNRGASEAFGLAAGDTLARMTLPAGPGASPTEAASRLARAARTVLGRSGPDEEIIKLDTGARGTMVFRIAGIEDAGDDADKDAGEDADGRAAAVIVSTRFHWREPIDRILRTAFGLTGAESQVVRLLAEGLDIRSIAAERGTSEGTARQQTKSIIAKLNLRSQADVVRFALSLAVFSAPARAAGATGAIRSAPHRNWLEGEVWKPFREIALPDGRRLGYHDMGPADGNPVLMSHMGSCMVRWPRSMIELAFRHHLRVICPIRAGYGPSDPLDPACDVLATASGDAAHLLSTLGIERLPHAVLGTDFPLAADLVARHPALVSELVGVGGRPCLPGGEHVHGAGRWQRFFVRAARHHPKLLEFASSSVMAMSRRLGPAAMLRRLCADSPADLALLDVEEVACVLRANIDLMASGSANAGRAFAMEYLAFHADWSDRMAAMRHVRVRVLVAAEDPTFDVDELPRLRDAYPWIEFEVVPDAGLALIYQIPDRLVPMLAEAARRAGR